MHNVLMPVVVLGAWTIAVLIWGVLARLPAMKAAGIDVSKVRGSKPGGLDGVLPDSAQWKMHNYNHLTEQPTLFYAICIVLALAGAGDGLNAMLAWIYVALRILHSLVQGTTNIIKYRFTLFALSTVALLMLTIHAGMALLHMGFYA